MLCLKQEDTAMLILVSPVAVIRRYVIADRVKNRNQEAAGLRASIAFDLAIINGSLRNASMVVQLPSQANCHLRWGDTISMFPSPFIRIVPMVTI